MARYTCTELILHLVSRPENHNDYPDCSIQEPRMPACGSCLLHNGIVKALSRTATGATNECWFAHPNLELLVILLCVSHLVVCIVAFACFPRGIQSSKATGSFHARKLSRDCHDPNPWVVPQETGAPSSFTKLRRTHFPSKSLARKCGDFTALSSSKHVLPINNTPSPLTLHTLSQHRYAR